MIDNHAVFVADAKPILAQQPQRSAYVFGAANPLGEALLNQILVNARYTKIYVSTLMPLPSTVTQLHSILASDDFAWQDNSEQVDCFMITHPHPSAQNISRSGMLHNISNNRMAVYAPVYDTAMPALLRQLSNAALQRNTASLYTSPLVQRWLVVAPNISHETVIGWLTAYTPHIATVSYSGDGITSKNVYQFQAQGKGVLDRLGIWLLNTLSHATQQMLHGQKHIPITQVKLAQHLLTRFENTASVGALNNLVRADLI
jgi:hypothetical protein